ncbi:hypothetical protein TRFO_15207 [Tritrichomonas foetus]|uniref:HEAT repeat family protein n=1 Tax=Tritrichomonas foetus TaxID=1144522 RepID=A0A1J4KTG3_9EUKA|nr:hypothetical protein TRFO_15207 [Tritrichomonas foetus]|eukprot:OHT14426.1 hypothetical protein TRFO_15207 [Tritrichomonas foetus]
MSSHLSSAMFFKKEDMPQLIMNVIKQKDSAQTNFIEAIPLFLQSMEAETVRTELIPFIKNWINFGDRTNATLFTSMLPLFMPPHLPAFIFFDLLFPMNDIIRQSAMFIEKQMMEVCKTIADVFDIESIQTFILPSLDQLFIPSNTDSQGLAIRVQSYFIPLANKNWHDKITSRIRKLSDNESSYIRVCVLKSLSEIITVSDQPNELIRELIIPKFHDSDFKVRTAAISTACSLGNLFFSDHEFITKFLKNSDDESWYVRFAVTHHLKEAIESAPDRVVFAAPLLKLTQDSVNQIHSLALKVLTETVHFFPTSSLDIIPKIIEQGMKSPQEDIRTATIDLWASLLKHHPSAKFHASLFGTLNLIAVLPIEAITYQMMYRIIPLVPEEQINIKTLRKGFHTLLESVTPTWKAAGVAVLRLYSQMSNLKDLALEMSSLAFPLLEAPSLMVRCIVGEMLVDFSKVYSWNWLKENAIKRIEKGVKEGNALVKQSLSRTIVELIYNDPPNDIKTSLEAWLNLIEKDKIASVQENAKYSHSIMNKLSSNQQKSQITSSSSSSDSSESSNTSDDSSSDS